MWSPWSWIKCSSSCWLLSHNTLLRDGQGYHKMHLELSPGQECVGLLPRRHSCSLVLFVVCVHLVCQVSCISFNLTTPFQQRVLFTSTATTTPSPQGMLHLHFPQWLSLSWQFTGSPEEFVSWTNATIWSPSLTLTWIWITRWVHLRRPVLVLQSSEGRSRHLSAASWGTVMQSPPWEKFP